MLYGTKEDEDSVMIILSSSCLGTKPSWAKLVLLIFALVNGFLASIQGLLSRLKTLWRVAILSKKSGIYSGEEISTTQVGFLPLLIKISQANFNEVDLSTSTTILTFLEGSFE